ncbi:MAG: hypothetical protein AB2792_19920 [Candidatus Thiodiazotropha sp.]
MSDVTGPISTLPGDRHKAPDGQMCDNHPDRKAVCRVQGETDSFGSELHDLCQECFDSLKQQSSDRTGKCDWCGKEAKDLRKKRDLDEGRCGPVYDVCGECSRNHDSYQMLRYEDDYENYWD